MYTFDVLLLLMRPTTHLMCEWAMGTQISIFIFSVGSKGTFFFKIEKTRETREISLCNAKSWERAHQPILLRPSMSLATTKCCHLGNPHGNNSLSAISLLWYSCFVKCNNLMFYTLVSYSNTLVC